jgi:hypothetical protein
MMWLFEIRQEAVQFGLVGHGITLNPWMMNVVKMVEQARKELGPKLLNSSILIIYY